jgi:hypothetical protein
LGLEAIPIKTSHTPSLPPSLAITAAAAAAAAVGLGGGEGTLPLERV